MDQIGLAGWAGLAMGLLLVIAGSSELRKHVSFRKHALRVPATVVGLDRSVGGHGGSAPQYRYHPILEFTTLDGRSVRTKTKLGSNPPTAREGDHVTVVYDPNDPYQAGIKKAAWMQVTLTVILTLLGLFFVIIFFVGLLI